MDETMDGAFFLAQLGVHAKRTLARPRAQRQTCASNQVAGPRVCPDAGVPALGPAAGPAPGPSQQQQSPCYAQRRRFGARCGAIHDIRSRVRSSIQYSRRGVENKAIDAHMAAGTRCITAGDPSPVLKLREPSVAPCEMHQSTNHVSAVCESERESDREATRRSQTEKETQRLPSQQAEEKAARLEEKAEA